MNVLLDIAATHLRGRLRQSIVAIAGVATGVGFSIGMAALMEGSQNDFISTLVDAVPHVRNPMARLARVEALPDVTAAPILRGQVVIRFGGKDVAASLIGINTDRQRAVSNIDTDMTAGSLDALHRTANGIVVGAGLADRLGAAMGDTMIVSSPAGTRMSSTRSA